MPEEISPDVTVRVSREFNVYLDKAKANGSSKKKVVASLLAFGEWLVQNKVDYGETRKEYIDIAHYETAKEEMNADGASEAEIAHIDFMIQRSKKKLQDYRKGKLNNGDEKSE